MDMKKLSSLTAVTVAILALVGCSQDGVINEAPSANQAIEFGTYLGRDAQTQTRATSIDLDYVKTEGFGVFAYYTQKTTFDSYTKTSPNFMYNEQVTYSTDKWTYSPVKYWPNNEGDMVSFFAYAPYNTSSITDTDNGKLTIEYTVTGPGEGTADKSKDLLYSEPIKDKKKQALNENVTFAFKHALSRIGFTVQGAIDQTAAGGTIDNGTTITVKKVMLSGGQHTYTAQNNVTYSNTGAFYKSAKLGLLTGNWSDQSTTDNMLFTLEPKNFEGTNGGIDNFTLTGDQTNAKKLNNDNSYLMIIPQNFSSAAMYVYVEYTVTTTDAGNTSNKSEITNYISKKAPINFEQGKAYTINLVLGMNSVDLNVNEEIGWGTETSNKVDLPENQDSTPTTPAAGA